ncbi:MAG: UTP--glucose-1-phosphate uridylyltransferase [Clostridia bacterium]|nr:UTP--glucose-1-phosphate uridylyltransferase [Clostridia bacterium]
MNYEEAVELLKKHNQEQLLNFYNDLDENQKENLLKQISDIDFELMQSLYENLYVKTLEENYIDPIENPVIKDKMNEEDKNRYSEIGASAIKNGELAICSMAGGQGTRLGHEGPKGTFVVDIEPAKSIFEILTDKLKAAYEKYGVYINWYIMTSEANNDETVKFFEDNNYFGYSKEHIKFFKQGELPLLDFDGKIVLQEKGKIFMAADGNGGIFEALYRNNILDDMRQKNIKYLCIGNVDNILINQIDSLLIGMMKENNYHLASKSVPKKSPTERVGVFGKINGKPAVIEYSDIDPEMARKTKEDGTLVFSESHFGCNVFSRELLEKIGNKKLPYHVARKKNMYVGVNEEMIASLEANTYKFEAFIFDGFKMADDILIFQVKREEEFAPIKNKEGDDSPQTAKELYMNYVTNNNHD